MAQIYLSAARKSSGKTTVSLGLCAAFAGRGLKVQPFKKGPDYIDPLWLTRASGRPCRNLDFHTQSREEIAASFARYAADADIALIEGVKGLHDGTDLKGANSNAALARLLNAPVILVLDVRGVTRGVAPLLLGYEVFDRRIRVAGVVFNFVGGSRHDARLRAATEYYTDIPVLGAVHRSTQLEITERHLGLMPCNEDSRSDERIARIAGSIATQVDLPGLRTIAQSAPSPAPPVHRPAPAVQADLRIGIARDAAFGFYYTDDLEALERAGAALLFFDTLNDTGLPDKLDGLFIGGGFPETQMQALEANGGMRHAIRNAIENGLPAYAECGGLMYLSRSLSWQGKRCAMVGVIGADTVMHERAQGRGYARLQDSGHGLWPASGALALDAIPAHEFHYSSLVGLDPDTRYAWRVLRGTGLDGRHDGIVYKNLLGCYVHLRDTARYHWAEQFVNFVRSRRNRIWSTSD